MPTPPFVPLAALFGLLFGSFLNVCITRLPRRESVVTPSSHCRRCKVPIRAKDNIPVLSFFLLRGKCRRCEAKIPWRYPAVEFSLGLLWLICALDFGPTLLGLRAAMLCFLLVGLFVTDLETLLLPDWLTLPGIVLGVILFAFVGDDIGTGIIISLFGAAVGAGLLLVIAGAYYLVRRQQGLGMGDVKLLALIGAFLGMQQVLLTFFVGTIATALGAMVWFFFRGGTRKWLQQPLPYGSFLCAAGIYAIFFGDATLKWYMRISGLSR
jgi:leader peptidase (prepilin peptidase)/N-methyltransferase